MKIFRRITNVRELYVCLVLGTLLVLIFSLLAGCKGVEPSLTLSPDSGMPGDWVTVIGKGFPPNETVTVTCGGTLFGSPPTDANGRFSLASEIPDDAPQGQNISFSASVGTAAPAKVDFKVLSAVATATGTATLPFDFEYGVWLVLAVVLRLALGSVAVLVIMQMYSQRSSASHRDYHADYQEAQRELARVTNELNATRRKYESLERQVSFLKLQYGQAATEVKNRFPQLIDTSFRDLLSEPAAEYGALDERIRALKAIVSYFDAEREKGKTLRTECLALANQLKEDEPALSDMLQEVINPATLDSLATLKPVLQQMSQQVTKTDISAQVRDELLQLEKSLENIRDYGHRLIPSRLVEFARGLIESPASAKENALREKTVQKIIGFVNDYLRL